MIEQIYLSLILVGVTIGAVLVYLWQQARSSNAISLALIRLNEERNFDAPALLREAWPLLAEAGLRGMHWQLDWFGTRIENSSGHQTGPSMVREIGVAEMHLTITLYRSQRRGERRYFDETLIEIFLLLLRTDMGIKAGTTDTTLRQMGKLNLFLQHDIKNIAQFIQLLADQVADIPPGKEHVVLQHLRTAAPLVRQRADRIVRTLMLGEPHAQAPQTIQLEMSLRQLCDLYQLPADIRGAASVLAPPNALDSALDNILKNYHDRALSQAGSQLQLQIDITQGEDAVEILIQAPDTVESAPVERLFEPFWSSNPAGLGIGLYQARQLMAVCSGTVEARRTAIGELQFRVLLPVMGYAQ